ncbi:hypothetical protein BT96DRAFT_927276 [Gymnopus androsaceus JB14]|uniref:Uncharacterized protein n=1 Tax=Gymnopus androsaceus JB14 TaxID=1447944 RepID=A0A6A4GQV9_9AGAR|nr:hypothetical protein BT96DRAFT_927276 [Gymnopus androsaceus JB14]
MAEANIELNDITNRGKIHQCCLTNLRLLVIFETKTIIDRDSWAQFFAELSASGIKKVYGILVNTSSFRVVEMDLQRHYQLLEDAKYTAPTPFSLALAVPCGESGASTMSGMMIFAETFVTLLLLGLVEYFESKGLKKEREEIDTVLKELRSSDSAQQQKGVVLLRHCMDRLAPPTWSQAERGNEEFTKKLKKMFDERELERMNNAELTHRQREGPNSDVNMSRSKTQTRTSSSMNILFQKPQYLLHQYGPKSPKSASARINVNYQ